MGTKHRTPNNWVDQGHPPHQVLRRVIASEFGRDASIDHAWLETQAVTILAMIDADGTEVDVANYLRAIADEARDPEKLLENARLIGIALWHIGKASIVRAELAKHSVQSAPK